VHRDATRTGVRGGERHSQSRLCTTPENDRSYNRRGSKLRAARFCQYAAQRVIRNDRCPTLSCRSTGEPWNDGSGSTSARRGPINGDPLRQFNVGPGSAIFSRWSPSSLRRSNVTITIGKRHSIAVGHRRNFWRRGNSPSELILSSSVAINYGLKMSTKGWPVRCWRVSYRVYSLRDLFLGYYLLKEVAWRVKRVSFVSIWCNSSSSDPDTAANHLLNSVYPNDRSLIGPSCLLRATCMSLSFFM
jgi:hypothetical protein